jgi:hypothetical protein
LQCNVSKNPEIEPPFRNEKMMAKIFDTSRADAQATAVTPCPPEKFDLSAYADYSKSLAHRCSDFWEAKSGVLIYRRMRVAEVFSYGCRNMQDSLAWQLGALRKSMSYEADIPNFLEPWYGIGTIASAWGMDYLWPEKQAPAVKGLFQSVGEALRVQPQPVEKTQIGKHILEMISYFLEKTKGQLPISLTDTQSPLNSAGYLIDTTNFMMDSVLSPDRFRELLDRVAEQAIAFSRTQLNMLREVIVWPGHGFASSPHFKGLGMSDDNMLMISGKQYLDLCAAATEKFGNAFGGPVFHSCGNWSGRVGHIRKLNNLRMVDGAFSAETDPDPNPPEPFSDFAGSGIIVHARIVGDVETITEVVKKLWKPEQKLIVTTYCQTAEEQSMAYKHIHAICH